MTAKYVYERRLGGGGMAEVFLARTVGAEGFQRPVAIKRVLPSFSQDPQFSSMFVNEARISAMLRHPTIVQVLDFDRDADGRLFLVMELVEGKDLDAIAEKGALPVPVVVYVIGEVLEGLAHAHEMTTPDGRALGIVHRDVSPHNVLCSWDGVVKVSDFGIAKAMLASNAGQSGMIKGKPLYMAPEQVTSPDAVDHRADLFACGVMFYELLTGRRLYQGATQEEILTDVIQVARGWRQIVPAHVARPDLPADVAQVAEMLLAPDRRRRFAGARVALDALLQTTSAPTRGAAMLAALMAQRFPAEVPRRRMTPEQRAALPTVAAADASGLIGLPPDAPLPSGVRRQMQAETGTIEPVEGSTAPGRRKARAVAPREARAGGERADRRARIGVGTIVLLSLLAAGVAAAATWIVVGRDDGAASRAPGAAPDAGAASAPAAAADAAAGTAGAPAADAAAAAAAPAVPIDAAPPPDAPSRPPIDAGRRPRPHHGSSRPAPDAAPTPTTKPEPEPEPEDEWPVPCDPDRDGIPNCR